MIGGGAPIKSIFDSREKQKKEDQVDTRSPWRVSQDATGYPARSRNSFWIDVPSRSAPNSPLASSTFSPQKNGSGNLSNFHYVAPVGNHVWSAPELPSSAFMWGVPPAFFDGSTFSTESSPMHSPRAHSPRMHSPRMHSPRMHIPRMHSPRVRSTMGAASPLHTKISLETHAARRETAGLVSVHPLPLPPGVPLPSPSTPMPVPSTSITQANTKTEAISMKDQWKKGKLIGRGTFGSVYVASNRENGALCAMKEVELFPDDPKSAECIKQLEQEIKLLSQLKHPNIVQYYGSDIVEDRLYIYLEYVHPGSINKYVREHCGAMTESIVRNFTRHILSGLAYLHSTKTIHRDIKGANLLVDSCGVAKLADFGMAKHLTGQVADLSLKGSPYWMAPEGCDGSVLLDDTNTFKGEKNALPNMNSVRGYEVIDNIKAVLERFCPSVVSCTDLVTLAAREAVYLAGGPFWPIPLGRRDGTTASETEANRLPSPVEPLENIIAKFTSKGLDIRDVVALSGAHTFGFARCMMFKHRLFNFDGSGNPDPELDEILQQNLQSICPNQDDSNNNMAPLDAYTINRFDNVYYRNLVNKMGLMESDQALMKDNTTAPLVVSYSRYPYLFYRDFAASMMKLANTGILTGQNGEIRKNCRLVN